MNLALHLLDIYITDGQIGGVSIYGTFSEIEPIEMKTTRKILYWIQTFLFCELTNLYVTNLRVKNETLNISNEFTIVEYLYCIHAKCPSCYQIYIKFS